MSRWTRMHKLTSATAGLVGGIAAYMALNRSKDTPSVMHSALASWTTNTVVPPEARWNFNWDQ